MTKISIFKKIELWVCGQYRPIIGRFVAEKFRLAPKSHQNFLFRPDSKIDRFIQKFLPAQKMTDFFFDQTSNNRVFRQLESDFLNCIRVKIARRVHFSHFQNDLRLVWVRKINFKSWDFVIFVDILTWCTFNSRFR